MNTTKQHKEALLIMGSLILIGMFSYTSSLLSFIFVSTTIAIYSLTLITIILLYKFNNKLKHKDRIIVAKAITVESDTTELIINYILTFGLVTAAFFNSHIITGLLVLVATIYFNYVKYAFVDILKELESEDV